MINAQINENGVLVLSASDMTAAYALAHWQKEGKGYSVLKGVATNCECVATKKGAKSDIAKTVATNVATPNDAPKDDIEAVRENLKKLGVKFKKTQKINALNVLLENALDSLGIKESEIDDWVENKKAEEKKADKPEETEDDTSFLDEGDNEPEYTIDDVRAKLKDVMNNYGVDKAKALLKKFKVENVSKLDKSDYADLIDAAGKIK